VGKLVGKKKGKKRVVEFLGVSSRGVTRPVHPKMEERAWKKKSKKKWPTPLRKRAEKDKKLGCAERTAEVR